MLINFNDFLYFSVQTKVKHSENGSIVSHDQELLEDDEGVGAVGGTSASSASKKPPTEQLSVSSPQNSVGDTNPQPEMLNKKALAVVNRVRDKLTGKDFDPNVTLDVPQQVNSNY